MRSRRSLLLPLLAAFVFVAGTMAEAGGVSCPASPLDLCDFYFEGYHDQVPTFFLPTRGGDKRISPHVIDSHTKEVIEIDSTGRGQFLCPYDDKIDAGLQFYGVGQQAAVQVRTFNQPGRSFFDDRCILLPVTAAQIPTPGQHSVHNLNPGDGNQKYPSARRCVIFKTGSNPPPSGTCTSIPDPTPSPPPPPPPSPPPPSPSPPPPSPPPSSPPPPPPSPPPPSPPPPPPSPPPPCPSGCPTNPLQVCDFYFDGYNSAVPSFKLSHSPNTDAAISPYIKTNVDGNTQVVEVDNSGEGSFLQCPPPGNPISALGQFYVTEQRARLYHRVFQKQPLGVGWFEDRCVLLPLRSVQVQVGGQTVNLNPGDGNENFPESRRCIVFHTEH